MGQQYLNDGDSGFIVVLSSVWSQTPESGTLWCQPRALA